jgi:diguanylate cyclase (GGDEF)-like protein
VARFGGDEFVALLPETDARGAREMGERIRRATEDARIGMHGVDVTTTVSIGFATYPDDGGNLDIIMDKADKAMYRAKLAGRNKVIGAQEA